MNFKAILATIGVLVLLLVLPFVFWPSNEEKSSKVYIDSDIKPLDKKDSNIPKQPEAKKDDPKNEPAKVNNSKDSLIDDGSVNKDNNEPDNSGNKVKGYNLKDILSSAETDVTQSGA